MHMFVKRCMCLQFSQDAYENYKEKRTKLGGAVVHHSLDIERHASKIYTRAMFKQFGKNIYMGFAYRVEDIGQAHKCNEA